MKNLPTWREMQAIDPQILDTLWTFDQREVEGPGGTGGNTSFHGNCIPPVVRNVTIRTAVPGEIAWDPFAGSGTALDVWNQLNIKGVASDINPIRSDIFSADARTAQLWDSNQGLFVTSKQPTLDVIGKTKAKRTKADLLFLHPPYYNIISFSNDPKDVSNIAKWGEFFYEMYKIFENLDSQVAPGGCIVLLCGDTYENGEVLTVSHNLMKLLSTLPGYKLKNHIVKNISGNRFNAGQTNLYYSRHARFLTGRFTHEDIWIFKKVG